MQSQTGMLNALQEVRRCDLNTSYIFHYQRNSYKQILLRSVEERYSQSFSAEGKSKWIPSFAIFLGFRVSQKRKKEFQHRLGTCTLASNRCNTTTNKARHSLLQYFQSDMISPTGVSSQLGLRPRPATHELPPNTSPLAGNSLSRR